MSSSYIYFIVDNTFHQLANDEKTINDVALFAYNYLINPINFNKSTKVSLVKFPPGSESTDLETSNLDWQRLTRFITDILKVTKEEELDSNVELMEVLYRTLQTASSYAKKAKECNVVLISAFRDSYNWDSFFSKIASILKHFQNVNLICIDTFDSSHEVHDMNTEIMNTSILGVNESNERNMLYTLEEAKNTLTSASTLVPKFKKPVEIYSYTLGILGIPDLEFNISAFPFTKKTGLHDYLTTKMIDTETQQPISQKYKWFYHTSNSSDSTEHEHTDTNQGEDTSEVEIKNPNLIVDGYKFGTTNLLIADLPADEITIDSIKAMTITGFFPKNSVPPWYLKNDSLIILPYSKTAKKRDKDGLADKHFTMYSELWYSMVRQKVFAMVRFVKKNGQDVKYGILYPQGYADKNSEKNKEIDLGVFLFVETIFRDDEKLANLPNLLNWKVKDPAIEKEMDDLVDQFCLDENESESKDEEKEELAVEAHVVSMNDSEMNDIFYKLRQEIEREEVGQTQEGGLPKGILEGTPTWRIRQYNSPLLAFERLIYLSSYFALLHQIKEKGDITIPLYQMYEKHMPAYVFEAWLKKAEGGNIFRPALKKARKQ